MRVSNSFGPALLASITLLAATPLRAAQAEPPDLEIVAREIVRELVDGKYDAAANRFAGDYKAATGRDQVALMFDGIRAQRGPCKSVIARLRHDEVDGSVLFTVKANWLKVGASNVRVKLRQDGGVIGVTLSDEITPEDEAARDRYETKAQLRPPFHGTAVARNLTHDAKNPHFGPRNQRHAMDFVMLEGTKTYRNVGSKNEDYVVWGQPALAPADGTVTTVIDGIPNNDPGQRDGVWSLGNTVVIDLGQGEYATLSHLAPGIAVRVGQQLKAGEQVGKVGSSGAVSEPMLHFGLTDKPRFGDAGSLPARFSNVTLDGKKVPRASPQEGSRLGE